MTTLGSTDDWGVTNQWVMNTWVRHEIGLKFVQINVQSTIKPQRARDRADYLCDEAVEMFKRRTWDIQVSSADIVDSLIVNKESAIAVLDGGMGRENCVIRFDNSS